MCSMIKHKNTFQNDIIRGISAADVTVPVPGPGRHRGHTRHDRPAASYTPARGDAEDNG